MEPLEQLKLFRLSTFLYFVEKISRAEGSTELVRRQIWDKLEGLPPTRPLVERIAKMDSMERLQALSHFINLLKTFAIGTRKISNRQWISRVDRVFENDDDEDPDDDVSAVTADDSANSIYEVIAVKIPNGGKLDFLGTVIKGCNLVSLDGLCLITGIPETFTGQIKRRTVETGNFWRVKCPYRGVELFLDCREAARYCRPYCRSPQGQWIMQWLEQQPTNPPNDPLYRRRFRMLEAVDSTEYIVTFLGKAPCAGHLVLIRASDGHVHVASFMKACVGLPLTEMEVWDDQCVPLTRLLNGPVALRLDPQRIDLLTIAPRVPVIVID